MWSKKWVKNSVPKDIIQCVGFKWVELKKTVSKLCQSETNIKLVISIEFSCSWHLRYVIKMYQGWVILHNIKYLKWKIGWKFNCNAIIIEWWLFVRKSNTCKNQISYFYLYKYLQIIVTLWTPDHRKNEFTWVIISVRN